MILDVKQAFVLKGQIQLPASKSYSIRAFFVGIRGGFSGINVSDCEDATVAKNVSQALKAGEKVFHVDESGTSLRFLLPLLPFHTSHAIIKGKGTIIGRPNHHLCETLRRQGMDIHGTGAKESVPIIYKGGALKSGTIKIDGTLSSQFISALLIALAQLKNDSCLLITGKEIVSADYIVMTNQILAKAGVHIQQLSPRRYLIKGNQEFKGLKNFMVPSDYGLAAFPMAAASLLSSNIVLKGNLKDDLIQSDGHILEFLKKMGVVFKKTKSSISIQGPFNLKGGIFSLRNCPDLLPIMAVLALFAKGQTKFVNVVHARVKESDRISDVRSELLRVGADVKETSTTLIITPKGFYKTDKLLDSHHDHRLAMAWTVLGMKIGCRIKGIESCRKSYPNFVKDMKLLGLRGH